MDFAATDQTKNSECSRIIINVGGFRHETSVSTLQNIPDTRLSWIAETSTGSESEKREYFFDRHPTAFCQVLNFYRTGKLHCPTEMCGPMFEEELTFWGIDEKQMEPCCWGAYTRHREAEENLKEFVGPGFEDLRPHEDSKGSCASLDVEQEQNLWRRIQPRLWKILDEPHSSRLAKIFSYTSCLFITISVAIFCATTMPSIRKNEIMGTHRVLDYIEGVCSVFFTIEFLMRFVTSPSKLHFLRGIMNWIDFFAIVPFYVNLIYRNSIVRMFLVIRIMRLFRFIKLSYGLQIMIHTLKASSHELILLLLMLLIPVVMFSSIVYYVEVIIEREDAHFTSVPESFWWCLITMTTVGYGDLTPQTWPGKVIGGACAICGVLIVALPISVIGSNFNLYYAHAQARLKLPVKQHRLVLGGVPGLLSKPLELSSRRIKKPKRDYDNDNEYDSSSGTTSPEMVPRRTRNYLDPESVPFTKNRDGGVMAPLLEEEVREESPDSMGSDIITHRRRQRPGRQPNRTSMDEARDSKPNNNGIILLKSHSLKGENQIYDSTPTLCLSAPTAEEPIANGTCNPLQDHLTRNKAEHLGLRGDNVNDVTSDVSQPSDVKPVARIAPKLSSNDVTVSEEDLKGEPEYKGSQPDNYDDDFLSPYLLASKRKLSLSDSELFIIPPSYHNQRQHSNSEPQEPHRVLSETDVGDVFSSLPSSRPGSPLAKLRGLIGNGTSKEKKNKQSKSRARTSTHPCIKPEFCRERRAGIIVDPITSEISTDDAYLETKI